MQHGPYDYCRSLVRDALLGLPVKDRDWVVVGST
ncbi:hypothetical protein ACUOCP_45255, partial [Escherichia sp. R-CC3]